MIFHQMQLCGHSTLKKVQSGWRSSKAWARCAVEAAAESPDRAIKMHPHTASSARQVLISVATLGSIADFHKPSDHALLPHYTCCIDSEKSRIW